MNTIAELEATTIILIMVVVIPLMEEKIQLVEKTHILILPLVMTALNIFAV